MERLIDAAISYAKRGWAVHALEERSKEPATKHGFKDATTNVVTLTNLWTDYPTLNVSIATGTASGGLLVIDLDVDEEKGKDGTEWLSDWEDENGKLPETACAITGRGGVHLYYHTTRTDIGCSVNGDIGVDVRCNGGYVMAPPSVHPNGNTVYWDLNPEDYPVAEANDLVYKLVSDVRKGGVDDTPFEAVDIMVEGQGRDNHLYRFCCSNRARSLSKADCLEFAKSYNEKHFRPPLPYRDVKRIVNSAYKKPEGLSEAAKAKKATGAQKGPATGGSTASGRPKKFEHNKIAKKLITDRGACIVDGIPAIRKDGEYRPGWAEFDSEIYRMFDEATTTNIREVKHYVSAMAPRKRQSSIDLIAFRNGVLDISTMEFRPSTEDDVILNVVPHDWNPDAGENIADEFLWGIACGDLPTVMNLHETIGMCMARDSVKTPMCPTLIGTGRNGKSTFINALRYVVGDENVCSINPSDISTHFQAASIVGKTANLSDDIPGGYLDHAACSAIKKIATGDSIHTDVKHSDGFDFRPYCTMVFSANDFPRLADTSHGMMRRLHPIEFRASFEPGSGESDINMADKIETEEAAQRFIVLGVEALRRLRETGSMTETEASGKIKGEMMLENNSVLQWLDDIGGEQMVFDLTKDEAYDQYHEWAGNNGYAKTMVTSGTFVAQLKAFRGVSLEKFARRNVGMKQTRVRVFAKIGSGRKN